MKKNNMSLFLVIGAVVLVLIGGALMMSKKTPPAPVAETNDEEEVSADLPVVDSSVVVDLKARADKKAVNLSVSNIPADTQSLEYELSYTTGEGLPKGALGKIDLSGKTSVEREILLGTCSKNTCTYDTGVTAVNLVLKFNQSTGPTQFSKEYTL